MAEEAPAQFAAQSNRGLWRGTPHLAQDLRSIVFPSSEREANTRQQKGAGTSHTGVPHAWQQAAGDLPASPAACGKNA